jgi:hypothetical protein
MKHTPNKGYCLTLEALLVAATCLLGRVLLKFIFQEQFAVRSVCETPTRELNHPSAIFQIVFFLVLACVFDS